MRFRFIEVFDWPDHTAESPLPLFQNPSISAINVIMRPCPFEDSMDVLSNISCRRRNAVPDRPQHIRDQASCALVFGYVEILDWKVADPALHLNLFPIFLLNPKDVS